MPDTSPLGAPLDCAEQPDFDHCRELCETIPLEENPSPYRPPPLPNQANPYLILRHVLHELYWLAALGQQGREVCQHINPTTYPWDGAESQARGGSLAWGIPFMTFDSVLTDAKRTMRELVQVAAGNTSVPFSALDHRYGLIEERLRELGYSVPSPREEVLNQAEMLVNPHSESTPFARFLELDAMVKSSRNHAVPVQTLEEYQRLVAKFGVYTVDTFFVGPPDPTRTPNSVPILNTDCIPISGPHPLICPRSSPKLPVEKLADVEERFRSLCLVGRDQTVLWVGKQANMETVCLYREGCNCFAEYDSILTSETNKVQGGLPIENLPTGKVPGVISLNVLSGALTRLNHPAFKKRFDSWTEVPYLRLQCDKLFPGQLFSAGTIELLIAWFQEQGSTPEQARHLPLDEAVKRLRAGSNPPPVESSLPPTEMREREGGTQQKNKGKGIPFEEAMIIVREWLEKNAKANPDDVTRDAIAAATGVSAGNVSKTPAWKAFDEHRKAEAKLRVREVPLTDAMQAIIPDDLETPAELAELIEEQQAEEAEQSRRQQRRHKRS